MVTPADVAFSVWGVIFLSQGIFAVVQLLPQYRDTDIVQDGVSYYYVFVSTFQIIWSFAFGYNMIGTSLAFIVLIWLSLASIVYSQYCIKYDRKFNRDNINDKPICSIKEFWFFQFPFDVHCGWLVAATALNSSVLAVKNEVSSDTEITMSMLSLCVLYMVGTWVTFALSDAVGPNHTIALTISWGANWINNQLVTPKQMIASKFDATTILGIRNAYKMVSIIVLTQVILRVVYKRCWKSRKNHKDTTNKEAMKYALELSLNGKSNSVDEEKGLIH